MGVLHSDLHAESDGHSGSAPSCNLRGILRGRVWATRGRQHYCASVVLDAAGFAAQRGWFNGGTFSHISRTRDAAWLCARPECCSCWSSCRRTRVSQEWHCLHIVNRCGRNPISGTSKIGAEVSAHQDWLRGSKSREDPVTRTGRASVDTDPRASTRISSKDSGSERAWSRGCDKRCNSQLCSESIRPT